MSQNALLHAKNPSSVWTEVGCDASGALDINISNDSSNPIPVNTSGFDSTGVASLSVSGSSSRVALAATGATVLVRNEGTQTAFVNLGGASVAATTSSFPIDPLTIVTLARDVATETYIAGVTASSTTTLTVISGTGGVDPMIPVGLAAAGNVTVVNTSSTATLSNVSGSASSVTLLAASSGRKRVVIYNDSTAVLYLKFGETASTTSFTYLLNPGDTYESPSIPVYTGRIDGIWASATGAARVTEFT